MRRHRLRIPRTIGYRSHTRGLAPDAFSRVSKKPSYSVRVARQACGLAVREVVAGHHVNAVSETFHLANSGLRSWRRPPQLPRCEAQAPHHAGYVSQIC